MQNIKCVLVGDSGVGKTSLLITKTTGEFPDDSVPDVLDTTAMNVMIDGKPVNLGLWDTDGSEDYDRLRPLSYPQTDVFVVVFSISSKSSLDSVGAKWIPEIRHHAPEAHIVLVGAKSDLRGDPHHGRKTTSLTAAQHMATQSGAEAMIECSALTRVDVDTVFERAVQSVTDPTKPRVKRVCLLTTVCIQERGLADDCDELTLQRQLRDGYVQALPGGRDLIAEYYRTAPLIVAAMEQDPERPEIVDRVWGVIDRCTHLVRTGQHAAALDRYVGMVRALQSRYDVAR